VAVLLITPLGLQASTNLEDYDQLSIQERIAYLTGRIAQLQALIELIEEEEGNYSSSGSSRFDVDTLSASDVRDDEADLRARIDLGRNDEVIVWFEYGEDDDDLDDRTSKRKLYDSRGTRQTISFNVDDLDEDERYYFRAVAEDEDGDRKYGSTKSFRTDDDNRRNDDDDDDDFELSVSDTSVDEGDTIEVDWELPSRDEGSSNWIGVYEVGDDDRDYIKWKYLPNDNSGTVEFTIYTEGEYEFRLFLDNSYREEITSREVTVSD